MNSGMLAEVLASTSRSTPAVPAGHVLDREPAAPRLAEQVAAVEAEGGAHLVDLLDDRSTVHSDVSSGWSERPQPSWS